MLFRSDAAALLRLLARSATGQDMSVYTTFSTGPRRQGDPDGPGEYHVVLLDNGRSAMLGSEFQEMLRCIRCGACMNHCPVYARVGGHAYGTTYPGPIGAIISPHLLGLQHTKDLPTASSLCGACGEVCPVRIPIPELLLRLREEAVRPPDQSVDHPLKGQGAAHDPHLASIWRLWAWLHRHPGRYRAYTWLATRMRSWLPRKQLGWTLHRIALQPAARSFQERLAQRRHGDMG